MPTDEIAKKKWLSMPSDIRKRFEGNVFCSACGVTEIVDYEVDSVDYNIYLKGSCKKCKKPVARVID
jgi:hypothetical protein